MDYQVDLDIFKGPLDLLLYLVKKEEVSIRDIAISKIADQYIEYLEIMKTLNLKIAGDFLVMATILMRIKANELLPQSEKDKILNNDGDEIDREKLIEQIEEYQKYKTATNTFRQLEEENFGAFYRPKAEKIDYTADDFLEQKEVEIYDLMISFKKIVETAKKEPVYFMEADNVSIDDRIEHIMSIVSEKKKMLFSDCFVDDMRKIVLVVTFTAMLELVKMGHIYFRQENHLGEIWVYEKEASSDDNVLDEIINDQD